MSHADPGPLANYNSLADKHLSGYFNNTKAKKHLRKSGLITRNGEIISEETFRLNMARKEHKKHVKNLLAQAIVHKSLDMERYRQVEIRRKLEEIAKIELVRRVREERDRKGDEEILPYLSPRSLSRPRSGPTRQSRYVRDYRRATSAPQGQVTQQGEGEGEEEEPEYKEHRQMEPIYIDEDGYPVNETQELATPIIDARQSSYPKGEIDSRHLWALDKVALQNYTLNNDTLDKGRGAPSPYLLPLLPQRSSSPRSTSSGSSGQRSPRSKKHPKYRGLVDTHVSPPKPKSNKGSLMLHRSEPAMKHQARLQSMCEVTMKYLGSHINLERDGVDLHHEIMADQQHCGGNTLPVFKERLLPKSTFTFTSRRHRGYPFSVTFYINGIMDVRLSACCEYKHFKGRILGGKTGHFQFIGIEGAAPCYRCQLEKGLDINTRPPLQQSKHVKKALEEEQKRKEQKQRKKEEKKKREQEKSDDKPEETAQEDGKTQKDGTDTKQDKDEYSDEEFENEEDERAESKADTKSKDGDAKKTDQEDNYEDDDFEEEKSDKKSPAAVSSAATEDEEVKGYSSEDFEQDHGENHVTVPVLTSDNETDRTEPKRRRNKKRSVKSMSDSESVSTVEKGRESDKEIESEKVKGQELENKVELADAAPEDENEDKEEPDDFEDDVALSPRSDMSKSARSDHSDKSVKSSSSVKSTISIESEKSAKSVSSQKSAASVVSKKSTTSKKSTQSKKSGDVKKSESERPSSARSSSSEKSVKSEAAASASASSHHTKSVKSQGDKSDTESVKSEKLKHDVGLAATVKSSTTKSETASDTTSDTESVKSERAEAGDGGDKKPDDHVVISATEGDGKPNIETDADGKDSQTGDSDSDSDTTDKTVKETKPDENVTEAKEAKDEEEGVPKPEIKIVAPDEVEDDTGDDDKIKDKDDQKDDEVIKSDDADDSTETETDDSQAIKNEMKKIVESESSPYEDTVSEYTDSDEDTETEDKKTKTPDTKTADTPVDTTTASDTNEGETTVGETTADEADGGRDPDKVAKKENLNATLNSTQLGTMETREPKEMDGSIRPLVEGKTDVEIKDTELTKAQVQELSKLIEEKADMASLILRNDQLGDGDIADIGDAIGQSPSDDIKMLNLNVNKIGPDGVSHVVNIIRQKPDLKLLLMHGNPLRDEGINVLVNGLVNLLPPEKIQSYKIRQINSTAKVMAKNVIDEAMRSESLQSLVSRGSAASQHSESHDSDTASTISEPVSEGKGGGGGGFRLTELDIGDCDITDTGADHVAKLIAMNTTIQVLNLSVNSKISVDGWKTIGEALKSNKTIKTLSLDYNKLGDEGAKVIADNLKRNKSLECLDLEGNDIGDKGGQALLSMVRFNTRLKDITLMPGNNSMSTKIQDDIKMAMALNHN